jgi:hypothetical protein
MRRTGYLGILCPLLLEFRDSWGRRGHSPVG